MSVPKPESLSLSSLQSPVPPSQLLYPLSLSSSTLPPTTSTRQEADWLRALLLASHTE